MERKKILLIDDDLSQLDLIELLFESKGFDVVQSISGINAIEKLKENSLKPDIIMVDLMMPEMSGSETIKNIRAMNVTCSIIAFTAVDDPDLHQEAIDAGCDLVITKPCKPSALVQEVEKLLINKDVN